MLRLRTTVVVVLLAASVSIQSAFAGGNEPRVVRARVKSLKQLGRLFAERRDPIMIQLRGEVEPASCLLVRLLAQIKQIRTVTIDNPVCIHDFRTALEILQGRKKIEPVTIPEPVVVQPVAPPPPGPEKDYWAAARATLKLTVAASMKAADGADVVVLKNGSILRAGETVEANHEGKTYRWTVTSVANGQVVLEKQDVNH